MLAVGQAEGELSHPCLDRLSMLSLVRQVQGGKPAKGLLQQLILQT